MLTECKTPSIPNKTNRPAVIARDALAYLQPVVGSREKGEDLKAETHNFISFLQSEGNSERAQQRFVDSKLKETWR
jgi:hypothetical protein